MWFLAVPLSRWPPFENSQVTSGGETQRSHHQLGASGATSCCTPVFHMGKGVGGNHTEPCPLELPFHRAHPKCPPALGPNRQEPVAQAGPWEPRSTSANTVLSCFSGIKFSIRPQQSYNVSSESQINLSTGNLGRVGEGKEENPELMSNPFLERKTYPVLPRSLGNKAQGFGPMNFPFLLAGGFGLAVIEAVNLSQPPQATSSLPTRLGGQRHLVAEKTLTPLASRPWPARDGALQDWGLRGLDLGSGQRGPLPQGHLVSFSLTWKKISGHRGG